MKRKHKIKDEVEKGIVVNNKNNSRIVLLTVLGIIIIIKIIIKKTIKHLLSVFVSVEKHISCWTKFY